MSRTSSGRPTATRLAVMARRRADDLETAQIALVDVATGATQVVAGGSSLDTGARWMPDGSLLYVSDADGWFQVVRLTADGHDRIVLTAGEREHGEPSGGFGYAPLPSPDGTRFVHVEVHDGLCDLVVGDLAGSPAPKRGRGRPPKVPRTVAAAGTGRRINPSDGVWRSVGWLSDGAWIAAVGEGETRSEDLWLLPVPGVAPDDARPRRVTDSMPAVLGAALATSRVPAGERVAVTARDGLRLEGTLWRPVPATGKRGGRRVPTVVYPHGGPTWQSFRSFQPFKLLLADAGFAFLDIDFRGSTGYGRAFRHANHDEWGHADVNDVIDAARWAAEQPWSDGRLAVYGGSYGGYLVLSALVEEPALWRAGVDLFGDSEIAESFRHGDRPGRLDLQRMMGSPDDAGRAGRLPPRVPGLSRRADRGAAADPPRAQGQAGGAADDRADGRGARDREQDLRGPLVRRRGPRLGAPREPPRRLRAHAGVPANARPRRGPRGLSVRRPPARGRRASPARSPSPRRSRSGCRRC